MSKASEKAAEKAAYKTHAEAALNEAYEAAEVAFKKYKSSAKLSPDGHILDSCGSASVIIFKPSHRFRTTLQSLDAISSGYQGAWTVGNFNRAVSDQSITASEKACEAARDVLEKAFPDEPKFIMKSYLD